MTTPPRDRAVLLARRPTGVAQAADFEIVERSCPTAGHGEVLVENLFLSVDPAMRGWIADTGNYAPPVAIGTVMRSLAIARVLISRHPAWREGDLVLGWFGWQEHAAVSADRVLRRVIATDLPLSLALGVLGINGITAYLALTGVGAPKPGETVVVSTAAGAVGSAVGQIARRLGCRTVGVAGGEAKVALCRARYGYDAAVDYKARDFEDIFAEALGGAPVDVYFDNTAGPISDTVMRHLAVGARVIVCGTAAISDWQCWPNGPRVERHLLVRRARMEGFVVFDHLDRWDATVELLAGWVRDGSLAYDEDVLHGLDAAPDALAGLYRGENRGKRVIQLAAAG